MTENRCDCEYFEGQIVYLGDDGGVDENLCECGHTDGQHENGTDECEAREGDPADWSHLSVAEHSHG